MSKWLHAATRTLTHADSAESTINLGRGWESGAPMLALAAPVNHHLVFAGTGQELGVQGFAQHLPLKRWSTSPSSVSRPAAQESGLLFTKKQTLDGDQGAVSRRPLSRRERPPPRLQSKKVYTTVIKSQSAFEILD